MKNVVIINGEHGSGKNTLINFASNKFNVSMISYDTPAKIVAKAAGWDSSETDDKAIKFLSDISDAIKEYNDAQMSYCLEMTNGFFNVQEEQILFVKINDIKEMHRYISLIQDKDCVINKLLIIRDKNNIDMNEYDLIYHNDLSLREAEMDFIAFIESNILC